VETLVLRLLSLPELRGGHEDVLSYLKWLTTGSDCKETPKKIR
jgi:hypothetical protein